jgi:four helix bundle protein
MPPHNLHERTRLFALAVLGFCRRLPKTDEAQETARQLRRAANSVRSNYRSARKGRSRAEFQAKLGTVAEEADECVDCLEYLRDGKIQHDVALIQEARELASIFSKSLRTARDNTNRMKELPRS